MSYYDDYSGIAFSQNYGFLKPGMTHQVFSEWNYQEFVFPEDYSRGDVDDLTPPLTGLSIMCGIQTGYAQTATVDYEIDHYGIDGWDTLLSGTAVGAHTDGDQVWFDIYFKDPIDIKDEWLTDSFRFGIRSRSVVNPIRSQFIEYYSNYGYFYWHGYQYYVWLDEGEYSPFYDRYTGEGYIVYREPGTGYVYISHQYGVLNLWYSVGYPWSWAYAYSTYLGVTTPIQHEAQNAAFRFRLLAGIADSGTDILDNQERHVVVEKKPSDLDTFQDKGDFDFWMSKPNPSKFAVESLYFDMRDGENAQVIDRMLLDPITKDVYFHIYYSSDGDPGEAERDWERKQWTRVPKTFQMKAREVHALPDPVTTKYVKLEFTHLSPEAYDPGEFQQDIFYKKHPKWVLNYFLARLSDRNTDDAFVASTVRINYDALDLAYDYYLDDLGQEPDGPTPLAPASNSNFLNQFLVDQGDASDQVDANTLDRIRLAFAPYQDHPAVNAPLDSVLKSYASPSNYPVEVIPDISADTSDVSSLRRESIIYEQTYPVMFFFVTCQHNYRQVSAKLSYDRAYFVGIRELAFTRDNYTSKYDNPLYIESVGDNKNLERNDFVTNPLTFEWVTHS